MNSITQWQRDLALLPDIDMHDWQPFLHQCRVQQLNRAELAAALSELGSVTGWLQETGQTLTLCSEPVQSCNPLLAGEIFAESTHWIITRLPRDRWTLSTHQLLPVSAFEANCLGERVTQLEAGKRNRQLRYWRLWQPDDQQLNAPICRIALLTAIEDIRS